MILTIYLSDKVNLTCRFIFIWSLTHKCTERGGKPREAHGLMELC